MNKYFHSGKYYNSEHLYNCKSWP